jgi:hypothetical protein
MSAMRFHTTRHSAVRASERNLSFEDLKNVVNYSDSKQRQGKGAHGGQLTRFRKSVDGKTLVAVAEIKGNECWIVTGYYED